MASCTPAGASGSFSRHHRWIRGLTALAIAAGAMLFTAREALAQEPIPPGRYVVLTNDGSRFEGELVERVAGSHVTLKLATGEFRTIQASDIRSEFDSGGGLPPGPAVGTTPTVIIPGVPLVDLSVPLVYHGPDAVQIHLTNVNNESGTLYREGSSGWDIVCQMPCSTTVDPKLTYKLHNSNPFHFPAGSQNLDLVADIGSSRRNVGWGLALTITGATVAGVVLPLIFSGMFESGWPTTPPSASTESANNTAAWVTAGVCGAMVIGGIVLLAVGPSSTLTTTSGQRIAKSPGIPLPGNLRLTGSGLEF